MIQEFDKHGGSPFNDDSSFNSAKALSYEDIKGQVGLVWNQIRKEVKDKILRNALPKELSKEDLGRN